MALTDAQIAYYDEIRPALLAGEQVDMGRMDLDVLLTLEADGCIEHVEGMMYRMTDRALEIIRGMKGREEARTDVDA